MSKAISIPALPTLSHTQLGAVQPVAAPPEASAYVPRVAHILEADLVP